MRRVLPTLFALAVALASLVALIPRPGNVGVAPGADFVIIAGAAGLRWDDVNQTDTPTMWQLARRGSLGALSVHSARNITCAGDGWLTLGAGNVVRYGSEPVQQQCDPLDVGVDQGATGSATLPDLATIVADNRALPYNAQPGALADAVRCTSAVGQGAALASARPYGRIDRYADSLGTGTTTTTVLSACALSIVDMGEIVGTGDARRAAARKVDAQVAEVVAARPDHSLVVVAGLADTDNTSRLHVVIADGPGYAGGWLTSPTTDRTGYVQLVDLAPTVLSALNRPIPTKLFSGGTATRIVGRPPTLAGAVAQLADADREASVQRHVGGRFFGVLTAVDLVLFVLVVPLLHQARRPAGPRRRRPVPRRLVRVAEVLLVAAALAVPAALMTDLVPWWRFGEPGIVFVAVALAVLAAATTLLTHATRNRRALAPVGLVSAAAAAAVASDVLTGGHLQLNGVAGYSALAGGRYAGVGVIGLGVLCAGVLLAGGSLAQRVRKRWRAAAIAAVGGVGMVLVGSPYLGADVSGAVALSAGVCAAAAIAKGGWITLNRLVWACVAGLGVTAGFGALDLLRPAEQRGSVGRLVVHFQDGTAWALLRRIGDANLKVFFTSPLTLLVLVTLGFSWFVLLGTHGGLKRVLGLYPAVRAALAGIGVATVIAGFVEAVAMNVLGAALATAVPLVTLAALRVLDHADVRSPTPDSAVVDTPEEAAGGACREHVRDEGVSVEFRGSRGAVAQ